MTPNQRNVYRKKMILWAFLPAVFLAVRPAGGAETAAPAASKVERTIAVVNNEPIFASELERESEPFIERYKKTAPEKEKTQEKLGELKKEILEKLVEEKLLTQEAKNRKIRVTKIEVERGIDQFKEPFSMDPQGKPRPPAQVEKAFQDQLQKEGMTQTQFTKRVEEQIMKVKLIEQDVKAKVQLPKDEEVRKFFEKIQNKIAGKPVEGVSEEENVELNQISKYLERMTGEQVRIRHILIRSAKDDAPAEKAAAKKKIDEVAQKLKGGEDFSLLAKKYSEDPLSKDRGGDLGFIAKGDLGLPEIDDVIFKMKEAEVSPAVASEIGFHLIKMVEKKAPHQLEYDDIKDDLTNYLAQRIFTQKLDKYLKDLRAKASIKINPIE